MFASAVYSACNQDGSDAAYQNEKYLTTITLRGVFRGVRMFASYTTRAEGSQTPLLLKLLINMIRPLSHVRALWLFVVVFEIYCQTLFYVRRNGVGCARKHGKAQLLWAWDE